MFKKSTMKPFYDREIVIPEEDMEFFCILWARYSQMIQPELDEEEVYDIMIAYFRQRSFTVETIFHLAELIDGCRFKTEYDRWQ